MRTKAKARIVSKKMAGLEVPSVVNLSAAHV